MKRIHDNSHRALVAERKKLSTRAEQILAHLRQVDRPKTDRRIARELGFGDMNSVRPRVSELVDRGELEEVGNVRCKVTGRLVRLVRSTLDRS